MHQTSLEEDPYRMVGQRIPWLLELPKEATPLRVALAPSHRRIKLD